MENVHNAVLDRLRMECNCYINDNSLISDRLDCSTVVSNSTLYRARLCPSVYNHSLTKWITHEPTISLNGNVYKIDTSCQTQARSANQAECNEASSVDDDNNDSQILIYGIVGLVVAIVICISLVLILLFIMWRKCHRENFTLSRSLK